MVRGESVREYFGLEAIKADQSYLLVILLDWTGVDLTPKSTLCAEKVVEL